MYGSISGGISLPASSALAISAARSFLPSGRAAPEVTIDSRCPGDTSPS